MVYIYLNGNFEIESFDDFKAAFMYVGKSNDFTQPKEAYLRHFAFNRVRSVNTLKKISLVNCLNLNDGGGKVIVFSAFVKLGLNESLFLESMLIDLVLCSNEFPEATNMQIGKKVIIIKDEQLKRKLQHHLAEKAYSQFISCRDSKENYHEVNQEYVRKLFNDIDSEQITSQVEKLHVVDLQSDDEEEQSLKSFGLQ